MGLGQCISNSELLDLWQLCEIDEKQYNMGPLKSFSEKKSIFFHLLKSEDLLFMPTIFHDLLMFYWPQKQTESLIDNIDDKSCSHKSHELKISIWGTFIELSCKFVQRKFLLNFLQSKKNHKVRSKVFFCLYRTEIIYITCHSYLVWWQ